MANKKMLLAENKPPQTSKGGGAGFCVYIGPTIVGLAQNGTIYPGTKQQAKMSPELALLMEKYPLAADLPVDGEKLAEARAKVREPGNLLNNKYKQLCRMMAEER